MPCSLLLRGAAAGAVGWSIASACFAQEALPTIEIGSEARSAPPVVTPGGAGDPRAYSRPETSAATKTDTPIMKTPADVVVIPQQVLRDQQVVRVDDAVQNVSNVVPISVGGLQSGYLIRGFDEYSYYLDGVKVLNHVTPIEENVADVQQIEVLKGPASILYGRAEAGGMINLTTKTPLDTPYYSVSQQFGSYRFYRTTFDATGPLDDEKSLLYRINIAYEDAHSFREFVENRSLLVAPKIRWAPTQDTVFNFYLRYTNGVGPLDFGIPNFVDSTTFKPLAITRVPRSRNYGEPGSQDSNYGIRAGFNWTHEFDRNWSVTQRFDFYQLHAIGNVVVPFDVETPCAGGACTIGRLINNPDVEDRTFFTSAELRGKVETFGVEHSLLAGWEFLKNNGYQRRSFAFGMAGIDFVYPVHSGLPTYLLDSPDRKYTIDRGNGWHGFYLQDQISLPADFHLLAGFRYDTTRTYSRQLFSVPAADLKSNSVAEDAITPRIGLLWQPIPELSLFGDYVEGFGPATLISGDGAPNLDLLRPQRSRQWEGGFKTSLLNDRLTATVAWFDITKTNVPTPSPIPELAALGKQVSTGEIRNTGVDVDFSGQLSPELKAIGNFAYTDSRITRDNNGNQGNHYYGVPRYSGSLWAVYEPQWELLKGFSFGAGLRSRSSVELDNANSFRIAGWTTTNLMARYAFDYEKSKINLQLNVDNLTDTTYYWPQGGGGFVYPGTPRMFMGSVKVEF